MIGYLLFAVWYFVGIALAEGFWPTFFSIVTPYGLYISVVEAMEVIKSIHLSGFCL